MAKRSTLLVAIGLVVFVLGAGVVLVSLHAHTSSGKTEVGSSGSTAAGAVVVVTKTVAAGTSGGTLIDSKEVELRSVAKSLYAAGDLTSLVSLAGETLNRPLAAGTPITSSDVSLAAGPLAPPKGDESMALTLDSGASGIAGYLQPGTKVDVYANVTRATGTAAGDLQTPCVTLVETRLEILDVSDEVPAYDPGSSSARDVPGSLTVLAAVTPAEAMKLAFYTENETLYFGQSNESTASVTGQCMGITSSSNLVPVS